MTLSLGGGRHGIAVASAMLAMTALSACGGGSDSSEPVATATPPPVVESSASASPSVDPDAEITSLVERYWDVTISAENNGTTDRAQFDDVARGGPVEKEIRKLRGYAQQGILRVGEPRISAIEVIANDGKTAIVAHCIDEDRWTAEKNGKPLDPILGGNRPFGITATLTDGRWIVTDRGLTKAQEKAKSCP